MTRVYAINLHHRIAALNDGGVVPIIQMFDGDGEETHDPSQALAFYAGDESVGYLTAAVSDFATVTVH